MLHGSLSLLINLLQALKAVSHNYPNIVNACWEQVSAIVYGFLRIACSEVPLKQSSEHDGSPTTFISEKVLITAIKVLTSPVLVFPSRFLNA